MKGRPIGSMIRNRIAAILDIMGSGYGYEIFKIYKEIFGKTHIRTIYYNLKKGIEKEEIILLKIEKEYGDYSWGNEVQKIYYALGPYANIKIPSQELELIKSKIKNNENFMKVNWENEIKLMADSLKKEINDYNSKKENLSRQAIKMIKEKLENKSIKLKEYAQSKIPKEKANSLIGKIIID